MREPRIRPARADDVPAVARLAGDLGYPSDEADVERRFRRLASRPEENGVFVAESAAGAVAGWAHVYVGHTLEMSPTAELAGLVVDETSRGAGLGEALVRRAEAWARERGVTVMRVRSNVLRERAHRFYDRLGYERVKRQVVFKKVL